MTLPGNLISPDYHKTIKENAKAAPRDSFKISLTNGDNLAANGLMNRQLGWLTFIFLKIVPDKVFQKMVGYLFFYQEYTNTNVGRTSTFPRLLKTRNLQ